MKRDHSPVLPGEGATDYARYMRTDELLTLQREPAEMVHRDELLFQVVHQSAELWFKLAVAELTEAAGRVDDGELSEAELLLGRASLAVRLVTDQLDMFRHLPPATFQALVPALGNGSGAESPGWKQAQAASRRLDQAFARYLADRQIDLRKLYAGSPADPVYRMAEAMVDWDERVALWRVRHYKIAIRIGSHGPTGTQGSPANWLAKLIDHRFFPELWQARTALVGGPEDPTGVTPDAEG
ncbi:tryptophan 2,3-dioxygenase [Micromonospora echinospora]|uniref:Tryptophan 2,3-dioxygenase n=1 Tax=Micromonospora echinospora TaxID=1877 RepID=A0A1C4ZWF9_MICEC|nr:tryptophan 2,3-dioxygenase family protein [Micromonospora echinospora]OZV75721.1 tryptophan 2,3-dioxygenase [Micromonospora echinospora]SCF37300.1 tryptophan 2,3-dioxygenase [Micromonospora echinospora]